MLHHGVEVFHEDRVLGISGSLRVLLDDEEAMLGELPDALGSRATKAGSEPNRRSYHCFAAS